MTRGNDTETQSFALKNDAVWRPIALLMISRYLWYRVTIRLISRTKCKVNANRHQGRDASEKNEWYPENEGGFVHVWSGVVGQSDKAAVDISMYLGLINPDLFDWR